MTGKDHFDRLHFSFDFGLGDAGGVLGGFDAAVAEYLADGSIGTPLVRVTVVEGVVGLETGTV